MGINRYGRAAIIFTDHMLLFHQLAFVGLKPGHAADAKVELLPHGEYCQGEFYFFRKIQISKENYVLKEHRLPDERGSLRRSKDHIFMKPSEQKKARVAELIHVPWEDRSYLIAPGELIDFCNAVNQGREPRMCGKGTFLLRIDDWEKKVKGQPKIPESIKDYILAKPIKAKIVGVMPYMTGVQIRGRYLLDEGYPVVIDRGKNDGIRPGMEFVSHREDNAIIAYVISTEDRESKLLAWWLVISKDKIEPGAVLSTRWDDK